jgi:hypothetical protein
MFMVGFSIIDVEPSGSDITLLLRGKRQIKKDKKQITERSEQPVKQKWNQVLAANIPLCADEILNPNLCNM